uniref:Uncharacterized protein n=1 Tax=Candidatus Kentrum sp. SD TaxID=2126332 RepID=A0A450YN90_9GAMM|nr:MAG: hypothetical protein BECKSD772F_GA0070984_11349 [Candidatus Kentron sp. SD]VFK48484.1 MAG: hypothetical protein BECKSD772E_GA0070983_112610 [Candidatus Kentron sp. SD]
MKILKSSLVAAFLVLGMWASQASADCLCNPDAKLLPSEVCQASEMNACGPGGCGCTNWQDECCAP